MQVAVDGPAGSGKSTICKLVAEKYGFIYLDTGAMYRAAALIFLKNKIDNLDKLPEILEKTDFNFSDNGKQLLLFADGKSENVTQEIRTPEISKNVSRVAAHPKVREVLTKKQQQFAVGHNVIMEGRDITTVVLPQADVKIFLTASSETRAKRRYEELKEKGSDISYAETLKSVKERDRLDSSRDVAPLKKAEDAELVDTSSLTIDNVVQIIGERIEKAKCR